MSTRVSVPKTEWKRNNSFSLIKKKDYSRNLSSPTEHKLLLQGTISNQAVQRLLKSGIIQTKLKISQSGDKYEQEADRTANRVIKTPESQVQQQAREGIQLQAKGTTRNFSEITPELESHIKSMKGYGQPIPNSVRAFFEPCFGHDFSQVRIHSGSNAANLAQAIHAKAFTFGGDIVFGLGQYVLGTTRGKKLLAHELTHIIQNGKAAAFRSYDQIKKRIGQPSDPSTIIRCSPQGDVPELESLSNAYQAEQKIIASAVSALSTGKLRKGEILHRTKFRVSMGLSPQSFYVGTFTSDMGNFIYVYSFTSSDIKSGTYSLNRRVVLYGWGKPPTTAEAVQALIDLKPKGTGDSLKFKTAGVERKTTKSETKSKLDTKLLDDHRKELRRLTGDNITMAYTSFVKATSRVENAIKAAAKADAEFISLIADVTMGFLAPGLARGVSRLANNIPASASTATYRFALAAQKTEYTKEIFKKATKVGNYLLKKNATRLFGETGTDVFLAQLRHQTRLSFEEINKNLTTLTDLELGVTYLMFSANVASENAYVDKISTLAKRFQKQVIPIGEKRRVERSTLDVGGRTQKTGLVWIKLNGNKKVLVLATETAGDMGRLKFVSWIHIDMKEYALNRAKRIQRSIPIVPKSNVSNLPADVPKTVAK